MALWDIVRLQQGTPCLLDLLFPLVGWRPVQVSSTRNRSWSRNYTRVPGVLTEVMPCGIPYVAPSLWPSVWDNPNELHKKWLNVCHHPCETTYLGFSILRGHKLIHDATCSLCLATRSSLSFFDNTRKRKRSAMAAWHSLLIGKGTPGLYRLSVSRYLEA